MNQPIEEKWKKSLFEFFRKNGGNPVYNDLESFIENLLEQEKRRMSEEVEKRISHYHGAAIGDIAIVGLEEAISIIKK